MDLVSNENPHQVLYISVVQDQDPMQRTLELSFQFYIKFCPARFQSLLFVHLSFGFDGSLKNEVWT